MAFSKSIVALFLVLVLVANTVQPSEAIRVTSKQQSSAATEALEKADAESSDAASVAKPSAPSSGGQVPSFPFPLLPFPFFPLPGGAPPAAGQLPAFPFPLFPLFPPAAGQSGQLFPPLLPRPGDAPPAGGQAPLFPFPLFPLLPLPGGGAPPAGQGQLFPGLPLPLFPLFPGFPRSGSPSTPAPASSSTSTKLSADTTPSPKQKVTDCLPPLIRLTPCMDYLTNTGGVSTPPSTCCDGFKTLVNEAPICLCHGLNGDVNKIMPAPMDFMRMMSLPATCRVALPMQTLTKCAVGPVPPLSSMPPAPTPVTAPSSAPSP